MLAIPFLLHDAMHCCSFTSYWTCWSMQTLYCGSTFRFVENGTPVVRMRRRVFSEEYISSETLTHVTGGCSNWLNCAVHWKVLEAMDIALRCLEREIAKALRSLSDEFALNEEVLHLVWT